MGMTASPADPAACNFLVENARAAPSVQESAGVFSGLCAVGRRFSATVGRPGARLFRSGSGACPRDGAPLCPGSEPCRLGSRSPWPRRPSSSPRRSARKPTPAKLAREPRPPALSPWHLRPEARPRRARRRRPVRAASPAMRRRPPTKRRRPARSRRPSPPGNTSPSGTHTPRATAFLRTPKGPTRRMETDAAARLPRTPTE